MPTTTIEREQSRFTGVAYNIFVDIGDGASEYTGETFFEQSISFDNPTDACLYLHNHYKKNNVLADWLKKQTTYTTAFAYIEKTYYENGHDVTDNHDPDTRSYFDIVQVWKENLPHNR